jgi:DNA-binding MarR family transcriptional regulator
VGGRYRSAQFGTRIKPSSRQILIAIAQALGTTTSAIAREGLAAAVSAHIERLDDAQLVADAAALLADLQDRRIHSGCAPHPLPEPEA